MTFPLGHESKPHESEGNPVLSLLRRPHLDAAEIELTMACPCRCINCGSDCGPAVDNELSTDELLTVLSDLKELGCRRVSFLGGEPLVHRDLLQLIQVARSHGMLVEIVT